MRVKKLNHSTFISLSLIRNAFIVILLLISCTSSYSQKKSLKFQHYGKQEGINQSSVNFIFQDHKDFIWVANFGGINKFDGYEFTSYVNEFDDSRSISDNSVWTIYERRDRTLWFGTKNGLSRYNREADNFSNFHVQDNTQPSNTLAVKALFEDKNSRFYIGSEGEGLFTFSLDKGTFESVTLIPEHAKISAISEDETGNLWVGTENLGLFKISSDRSQVLGFIDGKLLLSETIWSIYCDQLGQTWIGTDRDGLIKYDGLSENFVFCKDQEKQNGYNSGNKVKSISKGSPDVLWIGSATEGLSYYSYKDERFYHYVHDPYDNNSLFDNDVSSTCMGANGVLYVGFYMKGFDKVITTPFFTMKNNPDKPNTISNNNVYCMYIDRKGLLWLGTFGGGLNSFDPKTNEIEHFMYDDKNPNSISHDWVRIILEDSDDNLWVGTWGGGLNKFDRKSGVFKRYMPEIGNAKSLNLNIITSLFEDSDGELWIGTYGGGINIYQPDSDDFRSIRHDKNNENSLSDDHITSFYQDENGLIWICTYGGGLTNYNKKTNQFERFLPNQRESNSLNNHKTLYVFDEIDSSFFWITTLGGGINKFYYKENRFINYTEKNGLPNNSTMGMLKDVNNTYWVSTNNGISNFDPVKETFTNYTITDGLGSDDYNLKAFAQTEDGIMYFGGKNGITFFNPSDLEPKVEFPKVAFTRIEIEDSIYTCTQEKFEIPYKSHIVFDYAAINPDKTNNIAYAYQLVGVDQEWRNMNKIRHLEFNNLDPRNYQLRVKSTNGNNVWNDQYASINLNILPPWYMTWYFRLSGLCVVLLSAYSFYRIKLNRAETLNMQLENKVKERTTIINEKNVALESEKVKTESAYKQLKKTEGFKKELTSMIVHDLKNPLVTILSNSSRNSEDKNLVSINKSGNTMLNLIENVLEVQKFEEAKVKLSVSQSTLKHILSDAIRQTEVLAEEKRIQMINYIDASCRVNVDKEIIVRVFVNLITNAIKFSPSDSKIEVYAGIHDSNVNEIVVEVKDYGKGIEENMLNTIFDKFSQAESRDSGNIRSTGLGLTFCQMAVEAHGGKIWAESSLDEGSTFHFSLPKLEDVIISGDDVEIKESPYKNPLLNLRLDEEDYLSLKKHKIKLSELTIYEMGEWLEIFEDLEKSNSQKINRWKEMMVEALASFDNKTFHYLKALAENEYDN